MVRHYYYHWRRCQQQQDHQTARSFGGAPTIRVNVGALGLSLDLTAPADPGAATYEQAGPASWMLGLGVRRPAVVCVVVAAVVAAVAVGDEMSQNWHHPA